MQKAVLANTIPHFFSHISACSAESRSYVIKLRYKFQETPQINQSNFLIFNNAFVQFCINNYKVLIVLQ